MKLLSANTRLSIYTLSFLMVTTLVSCGTAQSVTNEDGIYSNNIEQPTRKVVVANGS
ncbi:hypothetical protein [Tenacibaculum sp. UWU-22]|uniref:hypothetical protein n=1 Tax=Tenacibaculum sp. UWU-22 TaxID=3234187 RepID=UPI0034DAF38C